MYMCVRDYNIDWVEIEFTSTPTITTSAYILMYRCSKSGKDEQSAHGDYVAHSQTAIKYTALQQ